MASMAISGLSASSVAETTAAFRPAYAQSEPAPAGLESDTVKLSAAAEAKSMYQQGQTVSLIARTLWTDVASVDGYLNITVAVPATPAPRVPAAPPAAAKTPEAVKAPAAAAKTPEAVKAPAAAAKAPVTAKAPVAAKDASVPPAQASVTAQTAKNALIATTGTAMTALKGESAAL